jgi:sugar lactone lactonase YvrE
MKLLLDGGAFFEGPRWHDGRWWVSDMHRHAVFAITTDGDAECIVDVPHRPSGLGWLPDGSLLVVSMRDRRLMRLTPDGQLASYADLSAVASAYINDMVVDREGAAYVGNFGSDIDAGEAPAPANIVRVGPAGDVSIVAEDLMFPNGMVISPDGRELVVCESLGCRLTAFTIESDGSLTERRVWAQLAPSPLLEGLQDVALEDLVVPDGCALDAAGNMWVADTVGRRCIQVARGGEILQEVRTPEGLTAFACMLGGHDGRTLLVCAAPDAAPTQRVAHRDAALFTVTVDTPHAGLP